MTLALIMLAGPAETNHDSGERTVFPCTPSQSRVTSGQISQVVEVSTPEAQRATIFHEQKVPSQQFLPTLDTFRIAQNVEHNEVL